MEWYSEFISGSKHKEIGIDFVINPSFTWKAKAILYALNDNAKTKFLNSKLWIAVEYAIVRNCFVRNHESILGDKRVDSTEETSVSLYIRNDKWVLQRINVNGKYEFQSNREKYRIVVWKHADWRMLRFLVSKSNI